MITPIILCGGSGTRLWPLSRRAYPKQLLSLIEEQTMLQATVRRAANLQIDTGLQVSAPIVITNEEHRFLVRQQLQVAGYQPAATYLEPIARNTAPAIALAALHLAYGGAEAGIASEPANPDALMLILPADHVIRDSAAFAAAVTTAVKVASSGYMVTFGIDASTPETGYGYIQIGMPLFSHIPTAYMVASFTEKPDLDKARKFIQQGDYCWNSGIFLFTAGRYLEELRNQRPDILDAATNAWKHRTRDSEFLRPDPIAFSACPTESIDYAVMQATSRAAVVPVGMGWSDVGSWNSLWEISAKDGDGNIVLGDVFARDISNSYVRAESRLVAVIGLQDVVVVETPDAVLVMHKSKAEEIKHATAYFSKNQRIEELEHTRVYRPWGWYQGIDSGKRFQVKRIMVEPGAQLSLQMHHHRAEHWVVVSGTAEVTVDGTTDILSENQSTYIPLGRTHRLKNPGKLPLHLIEVQSGSYLGEDDIVRFEDSYGRGTEH